MVVFESLNAFYQANQRWLHPGAFASGILFDAATLERIDNLITLGVQAGYLSLLTTFFVFEVFFLKNPERCPRWFKRIWRVADVILHFAFGALLSAYSFFYFKSCSTFTLIWFFLPLCIFLIINEMPRFQRLGVPFHSVLLSLCVISFLNYLVPIAFGFVGLIPFMVAWILSGLFIFGIFKYLKKSEIEPKFLYFNLIAPAAVIQVVFVFLFFTKVLPPVPIAVDHLGIYHKVEKKQARYRLVEQRPWWKFWYQGDQKFEAREGDQVFAYFRVFSPASFEDRVMIHWLFKLPNGRWHTADKIPVDIVGGRDDGFRGYTYKSNYSDGDWRVQIETLDGREVGRLNFEIKTSHRTSLRHFHERYD